MIDSPDCPSNNISPSLLNRNNCDSPFSTPIAKKRSHFFEESPSQDYENFILQSQEINPNLLDVGWKWDESPKGIKQEKHKNPSISNISEKRNKNTNKNNRNCSELKYKTKYEEEKLEENHGFYKFRQELMKIKSLENENENSNELDSKSKTATVRPVVSVAPIKEELTSNIESKTDSKPQPMSVDDNIYNNLFDDSDTDNLLIELSQKVESEVKPENKIVVEKETKIYYNKTKELLIKENIVGDDSFDDILLSIPEDDKETKKSNKLSDNVSKNNNKHFNPKEESSSFKNIFSRYNSMPSTSVTTNISNNSTKSLVRHSSMPTSNNKVNIIISNAVGKESE